MYAVGHFQNGDVSPGYVLSGCTNEPSEEFLHITQVNHNNGLQDISWILLCAYLAGIILLKLGVILVVWLFLKKHGDTIADTRKLTKDNYGLFWGGFVASVLLNVLLACYTANLIRLNFCSGDTNLIRVSILALFAWVLGVSLSIIVAIWFSCKLYLSIPLIFLWPCCKCYLEIRKKAVLCISLWSYIMFFLYVTGYAPFVFLAVLALPSTVAFPLLVYLMIVIFLAQFLAIVFTFSAKKWQQKTEGYELIDANSKKRESIRTCCYISFWYVLQALAFSCLFIAAACFSVMISAIGALGNYGIGNNNLFSIFSIIAASAIPTCFMWSLRKLANLWINGDSHAP